MANGFDIAMMIECAIADRKTAYAQYSATLAELQRTNRGDSDTAIENHKVLCQTVQRQIDQFITIREAYTDGTLVIGIAKEFEGMRNG